MKAFVLIGRIIGVTFSVFIFFISYLQFEDGYVGYGQTSVILGFISAFFVYRSVQKRKKL
jgi:hypothetical protein